MLFQNDFEHEPDARFPKKFAGMDIRDLIKAESTSTPESQGSFNVMHATSVSTAHTSSISLPAMPALQFTLPSTSDPSNYSQGRGARNSIQAANPAHYRQDHSSSQQNAQSPAYQQSQQQKPSARYSTGSTGTKRASSQDDTRSGPPQKRQSKWNPEEDRKIIAYRGQGMKWSEISARLWPRSEIGCRLHYQNYLEKRSDWDEEKKNKLARVYER